MPLLGKYTLSRWKSASSVWTMRPSLSSSCEPNSVATDTGSIRE